MTINIPVGYQLYIHTWENDGDNKALKIISGLTKESVSFFTDLAFCFDMNSKLGNTSVPDDLLVSTVNNVVFKHPTIPVELRDLWICKNCLCSNTAELAVYFYDLLCDTLLDYPHDECYQAEGNFCRVFDYFEVFYVPQEITNVTKEFFMIRSSL